MSLWRSFWNDETGAVVSAELVAVGTVAVVGGSAGLNLLSTSVNRELSEAAYSVRHLNQSYYFAGQSSAGAWTAGSCYTQPDMAVSIAELNAINNQPLPADRAPGRPSKKVKRNKSRQRANEQDDAAFLAPPESTSPAADPVEPADDVSRSEVVIEPGPDA